MNVPRIDALRDAAADLDVAAISPFPATECAPRSAALRDRAENLRWLHDVLSRMQSEATVMELFRRRWLLLGLSEEQMHQRAKELLSDLSAAGLRDSRLQGDTQCSS